MQLDMERNDKKGHSGGAASNLVPKTIKKVEEFKVGMDMRSWITVLEIYLKHFNKDEWVEIVLSNMENKVLSRIKNLEKYLIDTDGYEELKKELLNLYTVKAVELPVNLSQLSIHKQSAKENIADFGKAIMELVKRMFPSINESDDIDKLMQERFVEGLLNQRLREQTRAKMLKMRNIKKEENFRIQDLIKYAECKMASYDTDTVNNHIQNTSDSDGNNKPVQTHEPYQHYRPFDRNRYSYNQQQNKRVQFNYNQNSNNGQIQQNQSAEVPFHPKLNKPKSEQNDLNKILVLGQGEAQMNYCRPIVGQALFNNTLVDYMCDSGADKTIINYKTFNLLKRHDPDT
ncbi:hypothetical protein BpHYR1_043958, partial [Brachionus plicatilis]